MPKPFTPSMIVCGDGSLHETGVEAWRPRAGGGGGGVQSSTRLARMSGLADRGTPADVHPKARLDESAIEKWRERREATLAENAQRNERRGVCLRDSAIVGGAAGTVGGIQVYRFTMRRTAATRAFMGPAGQAFGVWVGFFMPFMFVSNVVRWRCQSDGHLWGFVRLEKPEVPKSMASEDGSQ